MFFLGMILLEMFLIHVLYPSAISDLVQDRVVRDFEALRALKIHYVNDRKIQLDIGSLILLWFSKQYLSIRWAEYMIHHNTLFVSNA